MELLQGIIWLFLACVVLLSLAIWLHTNRESNQSKIMMRELTNLKALVMNNDQITSSNNSTVAMGNVRIQNVEKKMEEVLEEIDNFQIYLGKLKDSHDRLVQVVSWKRPVIRMENPLPVRNERTSRAKTKLNKNKTFTKVTGDHDA